MGWGFGSVEKHLLTWTRDAEFDPQTAFKKGLLETFMMKGKLLSLFWTIDTAVVSKI